MHKSIPYFGLMQKKLDNISLITRENLEGIRVIRSFSTQKHEDSRFNDASADFSETAIKVGKLSSLLNPLTYIVLNFSIIAIIWFGGIRVDLGYLTQGQIIAFVNYMTQIFLALVVVSNLVVIFTKASASAARVNEIFEISSSIIENTNNEAMLNLNNNTFEDFSDLNTNSEMDELSTNDKNSSRSVHNLIPKIEFKNVFCSYDSSKKYSAVKEPNSTILSESHAKRTNISRDSL
jgi:ATP-binding cassette subfamily B protein